MELDLQTSSAQKCPCRNLHFKSVHETLKFHTEPLHSVYPLGAPSGSAGATQLEALR